MRVLCAKLLQCCCPRTWPLRDPNAVQRQANTFLTLHIALLTPNTPHFTVVLKTLRKALPSTTLYYKACTKHFPALLCTTKLAQSTSQYYFVLQSLHKTRSSTTLYYKACTKHFPVLLITTKACKDYFPVVLCTTKLAQNTFQYYFALQSLHKTRSSTTLYYKAWTTLYYKACTSYFPVLMSTKKACKDYFPVQLCTTKLAHNKFQYHFVLQSLHKTLPSTTLHYKACAKNFPVQLCTTKCYFVVQSLHKLLPSTTLYYKACTKHFPILLSTTKACKDYFPAVLCTTKLAQNTFQYYFVLQSLHKALPSTTLYYTACTDEAADFFVLPVPPGENMSAELQTKMTDLQEIISRLANLGLTETEGEQTAPMDTEDDSVTMTTGEDDLPRGGLGFSAGESGRYPKPDRCPRPWRRNGLALLLLGLHARWFNLWSTIRCGPREPRLQQAGGLPGLLSQHPELPGQHVAVLYRGTGRPVLEVHALPSLWGSGTQDLGSVHSYERAMSPSAQKGKSTAGLGAAHLRARPRCLHVTCAAPVHQDGLNGPLLASCARRGPKCHTLRLRHPTP